MKRLAWPISIMAILMATTPSFASRSLIQNVYSPMNGVLDVNIVPGVGVNINFEGVGEYIQTIIVDNRSFVGIKPEGCLAAQEGCQDPANLVHLTLLDKLQLPGVVKVNSIATRSTLTIRTRDRANNRRTYLFSLFRGNPTEDAIAQINFVKAAPQPQYYNPTAARIERERVERDNSARLRALSSKLLKGLNIALSRNDIPGYNRNKLNPIDLFILDVQSGIPLLNAATKHRIDLNLVSNLILLGS